MAHLLAVDEQLSLYPPEAQAQLLAAAVLERVRKIAHRLPMNAADRLRGELYLVLQCLDTMDYSLRQ